MQIVIITNEILRKELLSTAEPIQQEIIWAEDISLLDRHIQADVFIDLLFEKSHIQQLKELLPKLVIVNSVEEKLTDIDSSFVRICAWPTFLQSSIIEASSSSEADKQKTEAVFSLFNKKMEWVDDIIGFITPRVVSMIINEAFISLKEGVSTREQIDIAMKLGTNYPYGPFEWSEKIGVGNVKKLLNRLSREHNRYACFVQ